MSNNNGDGTKVLVGFLAGAAIGGILALLFAPRSGKETREKIQEYSDKITENAKAEFEKLSEKAKTLADEANKKIDEARNKFKGGQGQTQA